jgi:hypothetical protein
MAVRADMALADVVAQEIDGMVLGKTLYHSAVLSQTETPAVFLTITGGQEPDVCLGGTENVARQAVSVRVRGQKGAYGAGLDLAFDVLGVLNYASAVGFIDVRVRTSAPLYLGETDDGNPEWSINLIAWENRSF